MKKRSEDSVSVRELQQNLKGVIARVERGEIIEVTRRRRPVALVTPIRPSVPAAPWTDLEARRKSVFGNRILSPSGSEVVIESRGKW